MTTSEHTTLLWFTNALRLKDHAALTWAAARGPITAVYILDPAANLGAAKRWWLHQALRALQDSLRAHSVKLILRKGDPADILPALAQEAKADAVAWSRRYEPALSDGDRRVEAALDKAGIEAAPHAGYLLFDPASITTKSGTPYKVYGAFSKACLQIGVTDKALPAPRGLHGAPGKVASDDLASWKLFPAKSQWPKGLAEAWEVTEDAAHEHFNHFLDVSLPTYASARDIPSALGTSRLSPYLHWGMISPRQAWHAAVAAGTKSPRNSAGVERFRLELLWREFNWHLLCAVPDLPDRPLDLRFKDFPWRRDAAGLSAWEKGLTGYPIVDAGMRQLWQTGWMHNRVRMITASFLIKDLLIDWHTGMDWFWDCLVDGDLASNTGNWQWVAGCGADASPFFRIFNPITQSKKFDGEGGYIRAFVPELAKLDSRYIHAPWLAPKEALAAAGVRLGETYPSPVVDHDAARQRALLALKAVSGRSDAARQAAK